MNPRRRRGVCWRGLATTAALLLTNCAAEPTGAPAGRASPKPAAAAAELEAEVLRTAGASGVLEPPALPQHLPSPTGPEVARVERVRRGVETELFRISVSDATGTITTLAEVGNLFDLSWSPDGRLLAFCEGAVVHLADAGGAARQRLYVGRGGPYPGACFDLTWSADGRELSFVELQSAFDSELAYPQVVTLILKPRSDL